MSEYDRCPTCHRWGWMNRHKCPPKWEAWGSDSWDTREDSAIEVYGSDAEEAAEEWAKWYDASTTGYPIASSSYGECTIVNVAKFGEEEVTRVAIEGEFVPRYSGSTIKSEPDDSDHSQDQDNGSEAA